VSHELRTFETAAATAAAAAAFLAACAHDDVDAKGHTTWALSGGKTPDAMFEQLATLDVPWPHVSVFQVDERVAPDGSDERNESHLFARVGDELVDFRGMEVTAGDLEAAADRYAASLPEHFDLVHLGLGPDGHTASLVPGDPILGVTDRLVGLAGPYQGALRLTLTYPAINAARLVMWLVAGPDKRDALAKLLDSDASIPAAGVHVERSVIYADAAAAR
jgi:6-phosphogluconolactonase